MGGGTRSFGASLLPSCGNGYVEARERCDDGNEIATDRCDHACRHTQCGNKVVNVTEGKVCNDGNCDGFDGCMSFCHGAGTGDFLDFIPIDESSCGLVFDGAKAA
jgi:cysteine-rich repeat protein